jgi:hypothetical protein
MLQRFYQERIEAERENPKMDIYILFRDMRTYGFKEDYYREAANRGVRFIRYEVNDKPEVKTVVDAGQSVLRISVTDAILAKKLALDAQFLVLSAAVVPSPSNSETARFFKLALNPDGFFQEAHVKLRPVDFAADGVFLCGMAHYPKHLPEAISQAYGAAGRAVTVLAKDSVTASAAVFRRGSGRHGKGNRERVVYLANGGLDAVRDWLVERGATSGPLLYHIRKGGKIEAERLTEQAIYDLLRRRAKLAGVKDFSPHDCRRTLAGDLLDEARSARDPALPG